MAPDLGLAVAGSVSKGALILNFIVSLGQLQLQLQLRVGDGRYSRWVDGGEFSSFDCRIKSVNSRVCLAVLTEVSESPFG